MNDQNIGNITLEETLNHFITKNLELQRRSWSK
jgi:hypothetical protein